MKVRLRAIFTVLNVLVVCVSFRVSAHYRCDVDLKYGVVVSDTQLRVLRKYHTVYQINNKQQLFVGGDWVELDEAQAELVSEYARGLHAIIPQVAFLATSGIDLATESLLQMYLTVVGDDDESYAKFENVINKVKARVEKKFRHANRHQYLGPGASDLLEELDDEELMLPLSKTFATSLGSILTSLGAMQPEQLSGYVTDIAIINRQLAQYAENADYVGPPESATLPQKARWYCEYFLHLDGLETQMAQAIPALHSSDVIQVSMHVEAQHKSGN